MLARLAGALSAAVVGVTIEVVARLAFALGAPGIGIAVALVGLPIAIVLGALLAPRAAQPVTIGAFAVLAVILGTPALVFVTLGETSASTLMLATTIATAIVTPVLVPPAAAWGVVTAWATRAERGRRMVAGRVALIAALALVALASAALRGWNDLEYARRGDSFGRAVAEAAQVPRGSKVPLVSLAPFDWDRVYIFGPYMMGSEMEEEVGHRWRDAARSATYSEEFQTIVFQRDARVVAHVVAGSKLPDVASDGRLLRRDAVLVVGADGHLH